MGRIARMARRVVPGLGRKPACNGCGRAYDDGTRLIAGTGGMICRDCFDRAAHQVKPRPPAIDAVRCSYCGHASPPMDVARVGSVTICAQCLGRMEELFESAGGTSVTATTPG